MASAARGNLMGRFRQVVTKCLNDGQLEHLNPQKMRIGLALSGGSDSMSLAEMCAASRLNILACHVDHLLRPSSTAEAAKVAGWCTQLGLPCDNLSIDWREPPDQQIDIKRRLHTQLNRADMLDVLPSTAVQRKARERRRQLLADWAEHRRINVVFTGHHANDQVETFFLRIAHQSGLQGLQAISPVSPLRFGDTLERSVWLVRPLLSFWKTELRSHCAATGTPYLPSPENDDPTANPRQAIRAELARHERLPMLAFHTISQIEKFNATTNFRVDEFFAHFTRFNTLTSCLEIDLGRIRFQPLEFVFRVFDRLNKEIGNHTFGVDVDQLSRFLKRLNHDFESEGRLTSAVTLGCLKVTSLTKRKGPIGWARVENAGHPRTRSPITDDSD